MSSLAVQFARLRRHSDAAGKTYDYVSFLDLAHTLRVWADMKQTMSSAAPKFSESIAFRTATPSRHALRTLRGREFVYSLLPDDVTTHASNGVIIGLKNQPADAEVIANWRRNGAQLEVGFYAYISPPHKQRVAEIFRGQGLRRCTFQEWMNSAVVVGSHPAEHGRLVPFSLTREQLIRRVANELDASHPRGMEVPVRAAEASRATHYLLGHMVAGLPLPYLHLLKDSQDILGVAAKYFANEKT